MGAPCAVGLIGIHGYGTAHLRELERLASAGKARLVACADLEPPHGEGALVLERSGARFFPDWRQLLEPAPAGAGPLDIVVVAAPPHLHAAMAGAALGAGAHVLVEKPPVVTMGDLQHLLEVSARSGTACQVGFQSTGSGALERLRKAVKAGELGQGLSLGATGRWQRDRSYWARSEWAGRESLHGVEVRDGALSNAFAHALANCLFVAGAQGPDGHLAHVEVERYRANPIEVEDTACLRVSLANGAAFVVAVSLCAEEVDSPTLHLGASAGRASWPYEADTVSFQAGGRSWEESFARQSLAEELVDFWAGRTSSLSCPLGSCQAFVELIEAVHSAPVRQVPGAWVGRVGSGPQERLVVKGVDAAIDEAVQSGQLFSELGVGWAAA